jgi:hypothetical protein
MIMIGVKDVQCAEHIGRIVHISLYLNNTLIYRIKDYNGEEITGTFYQSELQKIDIKDEELWKIELAT